MPRSGSSSRLFGGWQIHFTKREEKKGKKRKKEKKRKGEKEKVFCLACSEAGKYILHFETNLRLDSWSFQFVVIEDKLMLTSSNNR